MPDPVPPPVVQAAAEAARLGPVVKRVVGDDLHPSQRIAMVLAILLVLFGGLATAGYFLSGWIPVIIIGSVFAVVAAAVVGIGLWGYDVASWLYRDGVVEVLRGTATVLAWRDIEHVIETRVMEINAGEGQRYPTTHTYFLQRGEQTVRKFRGRPGSPDDVLGEAAVLGVHRDEVEAMRQRLAADEVVDFGALTLSSAGVHSASGGVLTWDQVSDVVSDQGRTSVLTGRNRGLDVAFSQLRHGRVFEVLAHEQLTRSRQLRSEPDAH